MKIKYKSPFIVHTWFERDRANIWVEDANGGKVAEWWDENVVQMFEDGFFDNRFIDESVLSYLAEHKIIQKNYTFTTE